MLDLQVFADRLKAARTKKNMSQAELAKAIGVATGTISVYENPSGGRYPAFDKTVAIAETLEVSIDWLCGVNEEAKEELDGLELLNVLWEIIDKLDMSTFFSSENEFGYNERLNITCSNKNVIAFFREREKILPLLQDETLADYLKDGLRKAIFEKFNNISFNNEYPF